jgi:hypothetical protein
MPGLVVTATLLLAACQSPSENAASATQAQLGPGADPASTVVPIQYDTWFQWHSELYPYELEYPTAWQATTERDGGLFLDVFQLRKPGAVYPAVLFDVSLKVHSQDVDSHMSLDAYRDLTIRTLRRSYGRNLEALEIKEPVQLSGAEGTLLYARVPGAEHAWDNHTALVIAGNRVWWLTLVTPPERTEQELPNLRRILASFRVLE